MSRRNLTHVLALFAALAGHASAASEAPKSAFESRIQAVRDRAGQLSVAQAKGDVQPAGTDAPASIGNTSAGWLNGWFNGWGNWGNGWGNWCNWGNWGNWGNC
jgi:rSAM-associated Gly-rich repeat protein